ncbi:hypothetical protein AGMMS49921_00900 [Endomicrobiia bacterium]|nr:hypothetical protein AGMMS49921_00900 [Endomicrobiia bacterium]
MFLLKSNKTLFSNKYKVSVLNKVEIKLKINTEMYKITKIKIKLLLILTVSIKITNKNSETIFTNFRRKSMHKY